MSIGENIKAIRYREHLTQKELAEKAGLSIAAIQGYEQGKYEPKFESIHKLRKALNCNINELLDKPFSLEPEDSIMIQASTEDELLEKLKKLGLTNENIRRNDYIVKKKSNKENQIIGDSLPENLSSIPESELDTIYTESVNSLMADLKPEGKAEIAKYTKYIHSQPEYRKESDATTPIAAHNDNADDEEQQKLMKEDIDEL